MASVIDKSLDIPFALSLLRDSKEHLNKSYVPVRYTFESGRTLHWMKGILIGVDGKSLIVRPLNSTAHGKSERVLPENIHLWTSKMTPEQIDLAQNIREASLTETVEINDIPKVVDTPLVKIDRVSETLKFIQKWRFYLQLKKEITQMANVSGLDMLNRLKDDLVEAKGFVVQIESDIAEAEKELINLGVYTKESTVQTVNNVIEERIEIPKVADIPKVIKANRNWSMALADKYATEIIGYLKQNSGHKGVSGSQIMRDLYIPSAASRVLGPLVDRGLIEKIGNAWDTKYRLPTKSFT